MLPSASAKFKNFTQGGTARRAHAVNKTALHRDNHLRGPAAETILVWWSHLVPPRWCLQLADREQTVLEAHPVWARCVSMVIVLC